MLPFKKDIINILRKEVGGKGKLSTKEIGDALEIPEDAKHGDFAFPCFALAKMLKKAPPLIANEVKDKLELTEDIERVEVVGGYLNFFIKPERYAELVLKTVYEERDAFGASDVGRSRRVVVEFSSPNIAKPFGIGHLRSTVLGNALSRMYRFLNYEVITYNHLGDWGTQFGKIITAYKRWGKADFLKGDPIINLYRLYVKFHEEEENDEGLTQEARDWFAKLEQGDEEAVELWEWFRELSMNELKGIYSTFGIEFDHQLGESFYTDKMDSVVKSLEEKKLLVASQGAKIVSLDEEELPPAIIKKSDDSTLYLTRDLAAAIYRFDQHEFEKMIYVVGHPQELHFKQLFLVLKKMGYEWADHCDHVSFGHLAFKDQNMSTRKGNIVFLTDVLEKARTMASEIIEQKNPDLEDKDSVSLKVGIAALIYADFSARRRRDVKFAWEDILNFEGETGPYLQYTSVRMRSLISKFTGTMTDKVDFTQLKAPEELAVVKLLSRFGEAIEHAVDENEPFVLAHYVMDLAKTFNKFYTKFRVLDQEGETSLARVLLTFCASITLDSGLQLLGIPLPEKM